MRNPGPTSPGYVKVYDLLARHGDGVARFFSDGVNTGVGIVEFHSNGSFGTRPMQVNRNLLINNGTHCGRRHSTLVAGAGAWMRPRLLRSAYRRTSACLM